MVRTRSVLLTAGFILLTTVTSLAQTPRWREFRYKVQPKRRTGHAMAYDVARGVTVLYGGLRGETRYGDTWEYTGREWREVLLPKEKTPPTLTGHKMVYDPVRGRVVLFGGMTGLLTFNPDVYEYDGTGWTRIPSPGGPGWPSARAGHSMGYDSVLNRIVVFGGRSATTNPNVHQLMNDTWLYDGALKTWVRSTPPAAPSPREAASMVFDESRSAFLLFGGSFSRKTRSNETWSLDVTGNLWTKHDPDEFPRERGDVSLVYMPGGGPVLFGGSSQYNSYFRDTWRWNGVDWDKVKTGRYPESRAGGAIIYDASDQVAVLFGGLTGQAMNDTWKFTLDQNIIPLGTSMDFSGDGRLDPTDLFLLAGQWGRTTDPEKPTEAELFDRSNDGVVNLPDLAEFIEEWRERY